MDFDVLLFVELCLDGFECFVRDVLFVGVCNDFDFSS